MDDNPRDPRKDAPPGRLDLRNFRLESAHALVLHLILGLSAGLRRYLEWIKEELRPDERGLLFQQIQTLPGTFGTRRDSGD